MSRKDDLRVYGRGMIARMVIGFPAMVLSVIVAESAGASSFVQIVVGLLTYVVVALIVTRYVYWKEAKAKEEKKEQS